MLPIISDSYLAEAKSLRAFYQAIAGFDLLAYAKLIATGNVQAQPGSYIDCNPSLVNIENKPLEIN